MTGSSSLLHGDQTAMEFSAIDGASGGGNYEAARSGAATLGDVANGPRRGNQFASFAAGQGEIRLTRSRLILAIIIIAAILILTAAIVHQLSVKPSESLTSKRTNPSWSSSSLTGNFDEDTAEGPQKGNKAKNKKKLSKILLPTHLNPISYKVEIQPFLEPGNFVTKGKVTITFECRTNVGSGQSNNVTVHARNLTVASESVLVTEVNSGKKMKVTNQNYDQDSEFYTVFLGNPGLQKGKNYTLYMEYSGFLSDNLVGFYRSSYTLNNETKWLAVTQFQATDARRAFPCFDEPAYKARFLVSLARREGMTAVSNMPVKTTIPVDGYPGWVWDQFEQSVPMSTYLVAFLVSDLPFKEGKKAHAVYKGELPSSVTTKAPGDPPPTSLPSSNSVVDLSDVSRPKLRTEDGAEIRLRVFARRDALDQAEFASSIGLPILYFFENYFNVSYPLPKQDMVALPDMSAAAMENWGLVTYRESVLMYDSKVSSAQDQQTVAVVMAHELAHQWFGNLVTPKWWTDLWLNEGFASYLEYVGVHHIRPSWKIFDSFVWTAVQGAFILDAYTSSHPISIPVKHPDEIEEIFDSITYYKGSAIIRMMDHFLGNKAFRRGLTNYLREMAFKNAEQDDLWRYMTKAAHEAGTLPKQLTVKDIMDTWTLQMGYPLVNVERDYGNNSLLITQKRFLLNEPRLPTPTNSSSPKEKPRPLPSSPSNQFEYSWHIPVSYTQRTRANFTLTNTRPKFWLALGESFKEVTLTENDVPKGDWIMLNVRQTGYYRVNYDLENWRRITEQLLHDHTMIDPVNRAQVLDDAFNLARAGIIPYEVPLNLTGYLPKETEYVPWASALRNLAYLRNMLVSTSLYGEFKDYLISLIGPVVKHMKIESVDEISDEYENITDTYLTADMMRWACMLGLDSCVVNATSLFRDWMAGYHPSDPDVPRISPNMKKFIYCTAIYEGGEKEWDFAFQHFTRSNVASEQSLILRALGCTRQRWLLKRLLDSTVKEGAGIRKQDAGAAFSSVARNELGYEMAFHFMRTNFLKMKEQYGSGPFVLGLIKEFQKFFNLENHYRMFLEFRKTYHDVLGSGKRVTDQTLDAIRANIEWMADHEGEIQKWLKMRKLRLSGLLDALK